MAPHQTDQQWLLTFGLEYHDKRTRWKWKITQLQKVSVSKHPAALFSFCLDPYWAFLAFVEISQAQEYSEWSCNQKCSSRQIMSSLIHITRGVMMHRYTMNHDAKMWLYASTNYAFNAVVLSEHPEAPVCTSHRVKYREPAGHMTTYFHKESLHHYLESSTVIDGAGSQWLTRIIGYTANGPPYNS